MKVTRRTKAMRGLNVVVLRVRNPEGRSIEKFIIDSNSPTLDADLTFVFQRNVARARRENKGLFGSPDGFPKRDGKVRK
ncbi:MAG TPA: hypothetical protein VFA80_19675 [Xanthobacteraceae bacterium]|nr:hypothetical protein [Xanthobacteraceae bacterium]